MNIIILHGSDSNKSYQRLNKFVDEAKRRGWEIVNDKIEDSHSLFGKDRLIIIRNIKLINEKLLKYVNKLSGTLVIYQTKTIPKSLLNLFPENVKVEKYDLPILIWKFLQKFDYKIFNQIVKTEAVEYLMAMIAWKLKKNYLVKQDKKIADQIQELAEIDIKTKTTDANLKDLLDLFLIKNYS